MQRIKIRDKERHFRRSLMYTDVDPTNCPHQSGLLTIYTALYVRSQQPFPLVFFNSILPFVTVVFLLLLFFAGKNKSFDSC